MVFVLNIYGIRYNKPIPAKVNSNASYHKWVVVGWNLHLLISFKNIAHIRVKYIS